MINPPENNGVLIENIKRNMLLLNSKILEYSLTFKQEDFYTFEREEKKEIYKKAYYNFASEIKEIFSALEDNLFAVSSLLLAADREGDVENVVFYSKIFEAYLRFQKSVHAYTYASEKELSKNVPSLTVLFNALEKLKMSSSMFFDVL